MEPQAAVNGKKRRIAWNADERLLVAKESVKVAGELNLALPLRDAADIVRVVAVAQRALPSDRQRHVTQLWSVQADLPHLRKVGVIKGKTGISHAYRSHLKPNGNGHDKTKDALVSGARLGYRRSKYDYGELKVESGIPVPQENSLKATVEGMKKGDSIFFTGGQEKRKRHSIEQTFGRALGRGTFTSKVVIENEVKGLRVWRIK